MTHQNLLAGSGAGPEPTLLPPDPAAEALAGGDAGQLLTVVAGHPSSSLGWALLAEQALAPDQLDGNVIAYALARTGYHRGLDALRRAGWRGAGPIPWEHEPNRGFLRALWALTQAAQRIGDTEEHERCRQFLRDSSPTAFEVLVGRGSTG